MELVLIAVFALANLVIIVYSLSQARLAYLYLKSKRPSAQPILGNDPLRRFDGLPIGGSPRLTQELDRAWPKVTVQLPVYNEKFVVERLMGAAARFDYPRDCLEIQMLDDSTDETTGIVARKCAELSVSGLNIKHVRRADRAGYKAGALQHGLQTATGEFIAIFDADFLPEPDFLKRAIPLFDRPEIGAVQSRWTHLNEDYSMLTRLLAFAMDAHFSVEQGGRAFAGHFVNFNGTGGVLRRAMIEDAGGWQSDTLAEDLDLSYRAQLKGWKFRFAEALTSPGEIPATIDGVKGQQFRWTKGNAETAKKMFWPIVTADIPSSTKFHAVLHFLNALVFVAAVVSSLLTPPLVFLSREGDQLVQHALVLSPILWVSFISLTFFFWVARRAREREKGLVGLVKFLATYAIFTSVSVGLSLHNAIASIEGYLGIKSPFMRTAKLDLAVGQNLTSRADYIAKSVSPLVVLEAVIAVYFLGAAVMDFRLGAYGMMPFHAMFAIGYATVCAYSIGHYVAASRLARAR